MTDKRWRITYLDEDNEETWETDAPTEEAALDDWACYAPGDEVLLVEQIEREGQYWGSDPWFAEHYAPKLTDEFKAWWTSSEGGPPISDEMSTAALKAYARSFWERCAAAWDGWVAARTPVPTPPAPKPAPVHLLQRYDVVNISAGRAEDHGVPICTLGIVMDCDPCEPELGVCFLGVSSEIAVIHRWLVLAAPSRRVETFKAWVARLDLVTQSQAVCRAGEPVHVYWSEEAQSRGWAEWVVALEDDFWMDSFLTEAEADAFVKIMEWPLIQDDA